MSRPEDHRIAKPATTLASIDAPVLCSWCPLPATGFAQWPHSSRFFYPSCGGRYHGEHYAPSTWRACRNCRGPIDEQSDSRTRYCSRWCQQAAAKRRRRVRLRAA